MITNTKKYKIIIATLLMFVVLTSCKQRVNNIKNDISYLQDKLTRPNDDKIMVVAHRGDWRNAPENSLQAIQNCIDMGVDMVEIDVRATKDGTLVLMHDEKIDRTTTGKGNISDWSIDSIKTLYLRNGAGHKTRNKIPTLREAMELAKGKILINLDKCYDNFDKAYEVLKATGTIDHVVMKGNVSLGKAQADFGYFLDKVYFMPVIDLNNYKAEKVIEDYAQNFKPVAFEFVFNTNDSPYIEKFKDIRTQGSRVWVNSLWGDLNSNHEDDMALINTDSIYGWYVRKGVNIIQTDRPALLLDYLRKKGLHR